MKKTPNVPQPPKDFPEQLKKALLRIRVGDYESAHAVLAPLRAYLPSDSGGLPSTPGPVDYYRLRLATLLAEVAEYRGDYEAARTALLPYGRIVTELEELQREGADLDYTNRPPRAYLFLRQKLYYLWQESVWRYRTGNILRSRELLDLAVHLSERLRRRSETLLTQLYYGAGKLAFHECKEGEAMKMYRHSLMSASQRLDIARRAHDDDVNAPEHDANAPEHDDAFLDNEVEAARYSVAKTLALGLGQCLREQGRLEEAHTQVVAGRLLLNLGADRELSQYARLLLGSIERSIAGEDNKPEVLQHASDQIADCAEYFKGHKGEVGNRARLELALVKMQQRRPDEARAMLETMLETVRHQGGDAKWIAECHLGLSRVARRKKAHLEAVEHGRMAVNAADGLERIRRRAHTVLVLALYDAATDGEVQDDLLKATLKEIDHALASNPDIRTRANMLLTKARAHKCRGEIARAIDAHKEFEALRPLVEVGRIHELARTVESELKPVMNEFRCLADLNAPIYNLDENIDAVSRYIVERVRTDYTTVKDQARAVGRSRSAYYKLLDALKLRH